MSTTSATSAPAPPAPRPARRRNAQIGVGLAISLLCLWLAFRGLELGEVWRALAEARYWLLLPALALYFGGVWVRAVRWGDLLRPVTPAPPGGLGGRIPSGRLFPIVVIGYMANDVLPARLGEVVRCYVLRRREGVPVSAALGTVLLERVMDGIVMLAFMAVALPLLPFSAALYQLMAGAGLVFGVAVAGLLLLAVRPHLATRVAEGSTRFLPEGPRERLRGFAVSFFSGLAALGGGVGVTLRLFALSGAAWLLEAGMYYVLMFAFDAEPAPLPPSFPLAMLTTAVANLGTLIPSSPGYVGVFDFLGRSVLGQFGVPEATALAYVLVVHAALVLPVTLLGFWYTWRLGGLRLLRPEPQDSQGGPRGPDGPGDPAAVPSPALQDAQGAAR
jgi:glycosyltransferase 2 family protein